MIVRLMSIAACLLGPAIGLHPSSPIQPLPSGERVIVVPVKGEIGKTVFSRDEIKTNAMMLELLLTRAVGREPALIVLELDCVGGTADAPAAIIDVIKRSRLRSKAPIAIYVRNAEGAAAPIALLDPSVWVHPNARIGSASFSAHKISSRSNRSVVLYETLEQRPGTWRHPELHHIEGRPSELVMRHVRAWGGLPARDAFRRQNHVILAAVIPEYILMYDPEAATAPFKGYLPLQPGGAFDHRQVSSSVNEATKNGWVVLDRADTPLVISGQQAAELGLAFSTASETREMAESVVGSPVSIETLDRDVRQIKSTAEQSIHKLSTAARQISGSMEELAALPYDVPDTQEARSLIRTIEAQTVLARRLVRRLDSKGFSGESFLGTGLLGREENHWIQEAGHALPLDRAPDKPALRAAVERGAAHRDRWKHAVARITP